MLLESILVVGENKYLPIINLSFKKYNMSLPLYQEYCHLQHKLEFYHCIPELHLDQLF